MKFVLLVLVFCINNVFTQETTYYGFKKKCDLKKKEISYFKYKYGDDSLSILLLEKVLSNKIFEFNGTNGDYPIYLFLRFETCYTRKVKLVGLHSNKIFSRNEIEKLEDILVVDYDFLKANRYSYYIVKISVELGR